MIKTVEGKMFPAVPFIEMKKHFEKFNNIRFLYCLVWIIYHRMQGDMPAKTKSGPSYKSEHLNGIDV